MYNGCTLDGNSKDDKKNWCPTKVDANGMYQSGTGTWIYCNAGCPDADAVAPTPAREFVFL